MPRIIMGVCANRRKVCDPETRRTAERKNHQSPDALTMVFPGPPSSGFTGESTSDLPIALLALAG